ncbi:MAG: alpha/beta hydrolase [Sandaracinus sp.]
MSFRIAVGRRHLHVTVHGSPESLEPVVLVHSSGLGARQWRRTIEALSPRHRVIVPELVGYGESSAVVAGEQIHFAADLLGLERLLDRLAEPAHLVGHSYGGFLALLLAIHRPLRVRSVSVYEPVSFGVLRSEEQHDALATLPAADAPWPSSAEQIEAWLEAFIAYWNGPGAWQVLAEPMRATFRATATKVIGEVRSLGEDRTPLEAYESLEVPVLLLGSEHSTLAAERVLALLTRAIPDVRRVRIPGAGHMGPITHAAEVNAEIARFLATT